MPSRIDIKRKEKVLRRENIKTEVIQPIQPLPKEVKKVPLKISATTVIMVEPINCNSHYAEQYRRKLQENNNQVLKTKKQNQESLKF